MSMNDLLATFELIEGHEDKAYFSGPKSEELIARAEALLGLKFPPTYRVFLRRLGCGGIAGLEVYGIANSDLAIASVPNGIWLTQNDRSSFSLPRELVLIADTGEGTYYAIDTGTTNSDDENPVVEWGPNIDEPDDGLPVEAEDFGVFFRRQVEEYLSY